MSNGTSLPRRAAHWSLLLAALLQFGIAVLGPSGHLGLAAAAGTRLARQEEPGTGAPAPHSESACAVCHSLGSSALPVVGAALPPTAVRPPDEIREHASTLPSVPRAHARARAPPLA